MNPAPVPEPISVDDLWDLHARPDQIDDAAAGWRAVAHAIAAATAEVDAKAAALVKGVWAGPAEAQLVLASAEAAAQLRVDLDRQLAGDLRDYWSARAEFQRIAAVWLAQARGSAEPFTLPPEATGVGVIYDGDQVIVNTGPGDDVVQIGVDPRTGLQLVTINGVRYGFPAGAAIVVRSGEGNDALTVAPGTQVHFTLLGGQGNDEIHGGAGGDTMLGLAGDDLLYSAGGGDRVSAGAGRDYVDGGSGNDVLSGGLGDDVLYGLSGDDALGGGEGQDYLEGATGRDTISGGSGNDILSGGRDDDVLRGGAGDDVGYPGRGAEVSDGSVEQTVTVELSDLQTFIKIEGSDEFRERVEADLEMLGSSPRGQEMLAALQRGHEQTEGGWWLWHHDGDSLTIREYNDPSDPDNSTASHDGGANVINYNPHILGFGIDGGAARVEGPPVVVLDHEMAHVYDYMNDSLAEGDHSQDNSTVPNREREAAGLPIDDDGDPSTPERIDPDHPYGLTENGLRDEMGAPHRDAY